MLLTNSAILLVGDSGSGKTSLIATYADYVYEKYGKLTRYYSADPGGYGDKIQALVNLGIIQVWRIRTRDPDGTLGLSMETIERATQGYWPKVIDPETGIVEPGVELVEPRLNYLEMYCKNGHLAKRAQNTSGLANATCETCKISVDSSSCKEILKVSEIKPGFENIAAYAFDGITSFSNWCMQDMGARMARNALGGEKAAINQLITGKMTLGGTNRSSVGFVQGRAEGWIQNMIAIKDQLVPPVLTSLELKTTDDNDVPVYGPKIAGQAKTTEVPSWVGNCLGTAIVPNDKGTREWRLYLEQYTTPGDTTSHLCKNRAAPGTMPQYLVDTPGEEFTKFSLGYFLTLLEAALIKEQGKYNEKYKNAPGLASGKIENNLPGVASVGVPIQQASKIPSMPTPSKQTIPMAGVKK